MLHCTIEAANANGGHRSKLIADKNLRGRSGPGPSKMTMTDNELVAPRPLTETDASHLRTMFELQLHIADEEAKEDAADLIDYALDMVKRGKNVGSVVEEVRHHQQCMICCSFISVCNYF